MYSDLQEVEENDICPGDGFFPDPRSCTKFYRCVETYALFFAYEFECPQQTVFDPDLQVCNHPYAVRPDYRCHLDHFFRWKPRVKTKKIRATVTEKPVVDKVIRDTVAEKPVVDKVPVSNQTQPDFIDLNITMQESQ
ncbi:unnamed protein product [Orchesella dallaii]|uniref:Chitin-binding type-2 domain-containing protein n=1 Tax=Orchesella dallaii TaxID=48710 RepID=A0ABP1RVW5_9HEXA